MWQLHRIHIRNSHCLRQAALFSLLLVVLIGDDLRVAAVDGKDSLAEETSINYCHPIITSNNFPGTGAQVEEIGLATGDIYSNSVSGFCHTMPLGQRIQNGQSVLLLTNTSGANNIDTDDTDPTIIITNDEIAFLVNYSIAANQDESKMNSSCTIDGGFKGQLRMPTLAAANREGCAPDAALSEPVSTLLEQILSRILTFVDHQLPSLPLTLFETESVARLFQTNKLLYSVRKPAINVYTAEGEFAVHKDNQALTMLMPLSDPDQDFTGGGTAFWSQDTAEDKEPSLVLRPIPGEIMLFGGVVSHQGLPVESGTRVVFVASFSCKIRRLRTGEMVCSA